ncbi:GldG family protein [Anaerolentibacter hominis]|uniref:GldG family protein n=1 Tax=Anaerolentibacter hominis TaxID=3079009 RepID=UPI0031B846B7
MALSEKKGSGNQKDREQIEAPNTKATSSGQYNVKSRNFRSGAYSTIMMAAVIVIVLIVNLAVGKLDLKLDVSANSIFTLTDATKEVAKGITDDITIYYIAQEGMEADTIKKIVDKYNSLSSKIKVVQKDPVLYPNFASDYTDAEVKSDSVIVVNENTGAYKYVDYDDMLTYKNTTVDVEVNGVDVEGQITAALQRVTATNVPKMYYVGGHGETALGESIKATLSKQNIELANLNMFVDSTIPEDCDILLFNGISYDISKDEADRIKEYMENGGNVIFLLQYTTEETPNLDSLLEYYGMRIEPGVIIEDPEYYQGSYPTYLLPKVGFHESIAKVFSDGQTMIVPFSEGLQELDTVRSSVSLKTLLYTSDKAYLKKNTKSETTAKEEGDVDGPFKLSFIAEETVDGKTGKMWVMSTSYFLSDTILAGGQYGNAEFTTSIISYMTGGSAGLSIPVRTLEQQYVVTTGNQVTAWAIIVVGVIPLIFIASGLVIWIKRRRR